MCHHIIVLLFLHFVYFKGGGSKFSAAAGRMDSSQASQEMTMLNINQRVTALAAGNLNPQKSNNDILLVGTPTNLLGNPQNLSLIHI